MANLLFQVEADYKQLLDLKREIRDLESQLRSLNLNITPKVEVQGLLGKLREAKQAYNELYATASLAGGVVGKLGTAGDTQKIVTSSREAAQNISAMSSGMASLNKETAGVTVGIRNFTQQFAAANLTLMAIQKTIGSIKGAVDTIMNFEAANSQLAAILGTNREGVEGLAQSAQALGRETVFTASQVTQLQIELSKLGFTEQDIHALEQQTLYLAQATGASLPDAAGLAGAAMRMFQMDMSESGRVMGTISAATMSTALDFAAIRDNFAQFGPVAHQVGLSIEEASTAFGVLKNQGYDGSMAATSLRNILNEMAGGKISKKLGYEVQSFEDFKRALIDLGGDGAKSALSVKDAMDAVGKRGGAQLLALVQEARTLSNTFDEEGRQLSKLEEIEKRIKDGANADTTANMGETMTQNLAGSLKMLQSAWEGLILEFNESDGVLKGVVDSMTAVVSNIRMMIEGDFSGLKENLAGLAFIGTEVGILAAAKLRLATANTIASASFAAEEAALMALLPVEKEHERSLAQQAVLNGELSATEAAKVDSILAEYKATLDTAVANGTLTKERAQSLLVMREEVEMGLARNRQRIAEIDIILAEEQANNSLAVSMMNEANAEKTAAEISLRNARQRAGQRLTDEVIIAQKRLDTATTEAQAAAELHKAGTTKIAELATEKETLSTQINTVENELNAASTTKMGMAKGFAAKMAHGLSKAMDMLGLSMLKNPYVLAAAAITALGYAMYKLIDSAWEASHQTEIAIDEIKKKVTEAKREIEDEASKVKLKFDILNNGQIYKDSKTYKDAITELANKMEEYNITIDHEKDLTEQVIEHKGELIRKLNEEAEIRGRLAGMEAIENKKTESVQKAEDDYNEFITSSDDPKMEVVGNIIKEQFLTEEYLNRAGVAYENTKKALEEYGASSEQYKNAKAELNKVESEHNKKISDLAASMGISKEETHNLQNQFSVLVRKEGQAVSLSNECAKALYDMGEEARRAKYKTEGLSKSEQDAAEQAYYAKMNSQQLYAELQNMARKYNIVLDFTADTSKIPQWVMDKLGIKQMTDKDFKGKSKKELEQMKTQEEGKAKKMRKDAAMNATGTGDYKTQSFLKNASDAFSKMRAAEIADANAGLIDKAMEDLDKASSGSSGKKGGGSGNDEKARRDAEHKYQEVIKDLAKERKELERTLENDIEQARIDAMLDGQEKMRAQRELDHKKDLQQIQKNYEDEIKKYVEGEKKKWEANPDHKGKNGKKGKKDGTGGTPTKFTQYFDDAKYDQWQKKFEDEKKSGITGTAPMSSEEITFRKHLEEVDRLRIERTLALETKSFNTATANYLTGAQKRRKAEEELGNAISNMREQEGKIRRLLALQLTEEEKKIFLDGNGRMYGEIEKQLRKELGIITEAIKNAQSKIHEDEITHLNDYLKKYGTIEQRRLAITQEYQKKINEAQTTGEKANAMAQRDEEIEKLNAEVMSIDWEEVFNELTIQSDKALGTIEKKLRKILSSGEIGAEEAAKITAQLAQIRDVRDSRRLFDFRSDEQRQRDNRDARLADVQTAAQARYDTLNTQEQAIENAIIKAFQESGAKDLSSLSPEEILTNGQDLLGINDEIDQSVKDKIANLFAELFKKVTEKGVAKEKLDKANRDVEGSDDEKKKKSAKEIIADTKQKLKEAQQSAGKMADLFNGVGDNIKSLGTLVEGFGADKDGGFMSSINAAADGVNSTANAFKDFSSGNYVGAVVNAFSAINSFGTALGIFGESDKSLARDMERLAISNQNLEKALNNLTEEMGKVSFSDAPELYKKQMELLDKEVKSTQDIIRRQGASYTTTFLGWGAEDSANKRINSKVKSGDWARISGITGRSVRSAADFWNLTPKEMEQVRTYATDIYTTIQQQAKKGHQDATQYMDDYIDTWKQLEEIQSTYYEKLTSTTFEDVAGDFADKLKTMSTTAQDWSNGFEDMMRNAVVNALSSDFNGEIEEWYKEFAKDMESGKKLTAEEMEARRNEYLDIVRRGEEERDAMFEALGLGDSSGTAQATTSSAMSITEDTANDLVGRVTAVQIAVERGNAVRDMESGMLTELNTHLASLVEQNDERGAIASESRDILAKTLLELQYIRENTEMMVKPIQALATDMAGVRRKIDDL